MPYGNDTATEARGFPVGRKVSTEFGPGIVKESSQRRVYIELDAGQGINVATGTHGYDRLRKANP